MIVIVPNGAERVPVVTNKPVKSDSIVVRQRRRTTLPLKLFAKRLGTSERRYIVANKTRVRIIIVEQAFLIISVK